MGPYGYPPTPWLLSLGAAFILETGDNPSAPLRIGGIHLHSAFRGTTSSIYYLRDTADHPDDWLYHELLSGCITATLGAENQGQSSYQGDLPP